MKIEKIIDEKIESNKSKDWRRPHLGGSGIGEECLRKIWYNFRWFTEPKFIGRILRLFRRGEKEEFVFVDDLRSIGVEVSTGPEEGAQWSFKLLGGHFAGSIDGAARGLPGEDFTGEWALLEFKTHNEKSFNDLLKKGLKASKPIHFDQIQIYGYALGLPKALYLAVCKNDDRLFSEVVEIDDGLGEHLVKKAEYIINAKSPPPKISKSAAFFSCKWCSHYETCHFDGKPELNCRTCEFSKPIGVDSETDSDRNDGGVWFCEKIGKGLTVDEQRKGCGHYLAIL